MTNGTASPHPVTTLSTEYGHTETDTGNVNSNENLNGKLHEHGKGDRQGEGGLGEAERTSPSEPILPPAEHRPDPDLKEILRHRQQPTAFLLLAFLRHEYGGKPYFELPVETISHRLTRTPRTIRAARDALIECGDIVPYHARTERAGGAIGRRPNLYAFKEQGNPSYAG
jgi:hypothetical protein